MLIQTQLILFKINDENLIETHCQKKVDNK